METLSTRDFSKMLGEVVHLKEAPVVVVNADGQTQGIANLQYIADEVSWGDGIVVITTLPERKHERS
jgi:hypothetical protein